MNKVSRKREIIGSTYKVWDSIFSFIEVEKKKYIQNLLFKFKLKIWNKDKKRKKERVGKQNRVEYKRTGHKKWLPLGAMRNIDHLY